MKIGLVIVISILILAGCNKYPEGPWFTIRSDKGRMKGLYEIESYKVNGTDLTNAIISDTSYLHLFIDRRSGNRDQLYYGLRDPETGDRPVHSNNGDLNLLGDQLHFTNGINNALINYPILGYFNQTYLNWTVTRLSSRDLWIKTIKNDTTYEIKFRQL